MTRWFTSIVVASVGYAVLVTGNIEKVEFTGEMYTIDSTLWHRVNEQLSHLSIWPLLTPPYTFYGEQSIVPSDTDVDRVLLEHYTSDKQHNEAALLIQDTKLTERWYLLENITQGERYECRISYGATTPTDFVMSLLRYDQVGNLLFAEESDKSDTIESKIETSRLILRVQAIHAGVSNQPELSKRPVPYNIVLETLVHGIPYQALKLIVAIVVVLAVSWWLVVPTLERFIQHCLLSSNIDDDKRAKTIHDSDREDNDDDSDVHSHDDDDLQMEPIDELVAANTDTE